MILLDTHAVVWLHLGNRRSRPLERVHGGLFVSPATVLELQLLAEIGKVTLKRGATVLEIVEDDRWAVDDPASAAWFERAVELAWTRDPFDRLLVAHARLRGWRLATADRHLLEQLTSGECFEL